MYIPQKHIENLRSSIPPCKKKIFLLPVVIIAACMLGSCAGAGLIFGDLSGVEKKLVFNFCRAPEDCETRVISPRSDDFVSSERLPRHVAGAIIVSEDSNFYEHHGIDWGEVWKAVEQNLKERRYARGASTITQQLVKNTVLNHEKTLDRQLMEAAIALRLERILTKRQILDYYLNIVHLGPGVHGIREGARFYFNVGPEKLTPRQAALLAFFIPGPNRRGMDYAMNKPSGYREKRVKIILKYMTQRKYIDSGFSSEN